MKFFVFYVKKGCQVEYKLPHILDTIFGREILGFDQWSGENDLIESTKLKIHSRAPKRRLRFKTTINSKHREFEGLQRKHHQTSGRCQTCGSGGGAVLRGMSPTLAPSRAI